MPIFKELFLNIPLNEDLDVLEKQQYYIRFWHKVCEGYDYTLNVLTTLHVLYVKQSKILIMLHGLSGFFICLYPNNLKEKNSM